MTGRDAALTVKRIPVNEYIAQTRDVVPMSEHIPSSLRCFYASTLQNNDNAPHDNDGSVTIMGKVMRGYRFVIIELPASSNNDHNSTLS